MAFPVVQSRTVSITNGGGGAMVDMPATVLPGDLLLACVVSGNQIALSTPSGWTSKVNESFSSTVRVAVFAKVAVGNEDGQSINFGGSTPASKVAHVFRITDWKGAIDGVEVAFTGGMNPPSLSPSWGVRDTLWVAMAGIDAADVTTAPPSGFTNHLSTWTDGSSDCVVSTAYREERSATVDPGAFTGGNSNSGSVTIAVQPEPPPHTATSAVSLPFLSVSASGTQSAEATSGISLPPLSLSASGEKSYPGTSGITLPFLTLEAIAEQTIPGSSGLVLPFLSLAASGTQTISGTSVLTLPFLALEGTGSGTDERTGESAISLPFLSLAASGAMLPEGTSALTLPFLALSASGEQSIPGTSGLTLPFLSLSGSGQYIYEASANLTLPFLGLQSSGGMLPAGTSGITLPFLSFSAAGIPPEVKALFPGMAILPYRPSIAVARPRLILPPGTPRIR